MADPQPEAGVVKASGGLALPLPFPVEGFYGTSAGRLLRDSLYRFQWPPDPGAIEEERRKREERQAAEVARLEKIRAETGICHARREEDLDIDWDDDETPLECRLPAGHEGRHSVLIERMWS